MDGSVTRREVLRLVACAAAGLAWPFPAAACRASAPIREPDDPELRRLTAWAAALRTGGFADPETALGRAATHVGELAAGTPYEAFTLEAWLLAGGDPAGPEPLTLSLTRFDCVTLVESCLAIARLARRPGDPTWEAFGREVERMRYRNGERRGYTSRLHYFSEWISDGERRGLVRDLGRELGGQEDTRPLRFMTEHRASYPALVDDGVFHAIGEMERGLDRRSRFVVPAERIPEVSDRIETGDVLAFATSIPGLDVSHAAFAFRTGDGVLRVLHAPLSGGVVEITTAALPAYVAGIRRATGILVARAL